MKHSLKYDMMSHAIYDVILYFKKIGKKFGQFDTRVREETADKNCNKVKHMDFILR